MGQAATDHAQLLRLGGRSRVMSEHRKPWRWTVLALVPGLLSVFMFITSLVVARIGSTSESLTTVGNGFLYGAISLPLAIPPYLFFVGRSYVRAVHGGFQSAIPFVLLYSAANFVLWGCGAAFVGFQIRWS